MWFRSCSVVAILLAAGTVTTPAPASTPSPTCNAEILNKLGDRQAVQHHYEEALATFQQAAECATRTGNFKLMHRIWNNAGAVNLYQLRYTEALNYLLKSRDSARRLNDREMQAVSSSNLSSVYSLLGAGEAAQSALDEAVAILPSGSRYLPQILTQSVRLAFRRGNPDLAQHLWPAAMQSAQDASDRQAERHLWDELALLCHARHDLACVEEALANEFRVVKLHRLPHSDYLHMRLGRLRMSQGRPEEALVWFQRAQAQRRLAPSPILPWMSQQDLAAALLACRRPHEALSAYRQAWQLALAWRHDVLPSQSTEVAADVSLSALSGSYASLALQLAEDQRSPALTREAWAAVEQERAAGLRRTASSRQSIRERLGGEYRQALTAWRQALSARFSHPESGPAAALPALAARVTELESRAGVGPGADPLSPTPELLLRRIQAALSPKQALFTFFLADPRSCLWIVTRDGFSTIALPGRAQLNPVLSRFRMSVSGDHGDAGELGASLYRTLFSAVPRDVLAREQWLISAGDEILRTPLAALRVQTPAGAAYLAESHSLRMVPASLWITQPAPPAPPPSLLAIGDAIHNAADPRIAGGNSRRASAAVPLSFWFAPWPRSAQAAPTVYELPALAGSRTEVAAVISQWRRANLPATALTGAQASEQKLDAALEHAGSVIHFATHVIQIPRESPSFLLSQRYQPGARGFLATVHPDDAFLALSLREGGVRDGISTDLVSSYQVPGSLVVLSGCNSGAGTIQPGAGLMGFTRAWLAAGARSVVASLWPVTDDGRFFDEFYRAHLAGRSPAASLHSAQLAMIRDSSWRSQPRYWAAYFAVGKE